MKTFVDPGVSKLRQSATWTHLDFGNELIRSRRAVINVLLLSCFFPQMELEFRLIFELRNK